MMFSINNTYQEFPPRNKSLIRLKFGYSKKFHPPLIIWRNKWKIGHFFLRSSQNVSTLFNYNCFQELLNVEHLFSFYVYFASKYVWGGEKKEREFQKVSFRNDKALKHDIYL